MTTAEDLQLGSASPRRPVLVSLVLFLAATLAISGCLTFRERRATSVSAAPANGVVFVALENMPPGLVERAFLLSPSVSTSYDIRRAVRSVTRGLHVFYSKHDYWYLGFATHVLGTADRRYFHPASGRIGFSVPIDSG